MLLSTSTEISVKLGLGESAEVPMLVTIDEIVTLPDLPPGHCMSVVWPLLYKTPFTLL